MHCIVLNKIHSSRTRERRGTHASLPTIDTNQLTTVTWFPREIEPQTILEMLVSEHPLRQCSSHNSSTFKSVDNISTLISQQHFVLNGIRPSCFSNDSTRVPTKTTGVNEYRFIKLPDEHVITKLPSSRVWSAEYVQTTHPSSNRPGCSCVHLDVRSIALHQSALGNTIPIVRHFTSTAPLIKQTGSSSVEHKENDKRLI